MLLELGHQTEHTHDLGDPGAGDPLPRMRLTMM